MTLFNVHIYREMRLFFRRIEAATPEDAAAIARDKLTSDADDIDDCDGETLAALVDVVGDEDFAQSKLTDFDCERLRKAAPDLLEALKNCIRQIHALLPSHQQSDSTLDNLPCVAHARLAIAIATANLEQTIYRSRP